MINITTGGKNYVIGAFETLYRMEARDIGNVRVPVRKTALRPSVFTRRLQNAASQPRPPQAP